MPLENGAAHQIDCGPNHDRLQPTAANTVVHGHSSPQCSQLGQLAPMVLATVKISQQRVGRNARFPARNLKTPSARPFGDIGDAR
jgi:hypothetical protein